MAGLARDLGPSSEAANINGGTVVPTTDEGGLATRPTYTPVIYCTSVPPMSLKFPAIERDKMELNC